MTVAGLRWRGKQSHHQRTRAHIRREEAKNQRLALMRATKPGKTILKTKKSKRRGAYANVPMDDLALTQAVGRAQSSREDARAIATAINAKRAVYAETEWERNVLLGTTNPFA